MSEVKMIKGSVEYLYADVRADRTLDAQAVFISLSTTSAPDEWLTAEWSGDPGKFRSARLLLDGLLEKGLYTVFVRISDFPEAPIMLAGKLRII